ncbi:hypothetical protein SLAV_02105 [Streptomyces lavendulae subsp. lavendulae]|uniref:Uncharacterized protein n=2 Tax=Streptomyces lavendulae TaxID=1914 RepID=A0A2K8P9P8_STRLA|nr:hypothetical protein SLAV_02105 [Streptomyces lavendulae subsp. lavendulae]
MPQLMYLKGGAPAEGGQLAADLCHHRPRTAAKDRLPGRNRLRDTVEKAIPEEGPRYVIAESDDALTSRHVAERLIKSHPALDVDLVQKSAQTAYEELRYARVRAYLPVLMERRAKDLLSSDALPAGDT